MLYWTSSSYYIINFYLKHIPIFFNYKSIKTGFNLPNQIYHRLQLKKLKSNPQKNNVDRDCIFLS